MSVPCEQDAGPPQPPKLRSAFRVSRSEFFGVGLIAAVPGFAIGTGIASPDTGQIFMRILCIFVLLTLALRALGKRELSQLSPFELVMLLLLAEIVSPALTAGDETLIGGITGAAALLTLTFIHSMLTYHSRHFRSLAEARPTVIVRHGVVDERAMDIERIRPDEIFSEMHKAGLERLDQVKWGILEPNGKMSFVQVGK